jgi:LPS export ABC transporter protein LptC
MMRGIHFQNILSAAFITGCFFLWSCENKLSDVQNINSKSIGKDEARDVIIKYSVGGKRKAVLTGPLMYHVQSPENFTEFPKSIHVDFFDEKGAFIESKLDALYAKYQQSQSIVFLKDSVRVINLQGDTLFSNELYWDRSKIGHEFYTDKAVRIRRRMEIIDGIGLDASQDFKEWHIVHPIGFVKVPNSQFPN